MLSTSVEQSNVDGLSNNKNNRVTSPHLKNLKMRLTNKNLGD